MKPSKNQKIIYKTFQLTTRNLSIEAVAGSGKTTVLENLLKFVPEDKNALFLAFNNSVVEELKRRIPPKKNIAIKTLHSCGWHLILQNYGKHAKMNPNKSIAKTEILLRRGEINERRQGYYFYVVSRMLDLLRCNVCCNNEKDIMAVANRYGINVEEKDIAIIQHALQLSTQDKSQFDFMDMLYVPVTDERIRFQKFDYVFCDESQDFSLLQQVFIKNCLNRAGRLITVGDPHQAIYGFAGADAESYTHLRDLNGKCIKLPLSVSYRCAKNIVIEAQKIVPQITAAPNAVDGIVRAASLTEVRDGDWILCRNLKPLVQVYIWLLKNKIKSKIRGKEIGEGILALINKTKANTLDQLDNKLQQEQGNLLNKLKNKGVKKPLSHPRMELLQEQIDVIQCLAEEAKTLTDLKNTLRNIFSNDTKGILLSTIHKAKGLENERIFFLCPELIPSRFAVQPWEFEQEENLRYVAVTRAKKELLYVYNDIFLEDIKTKFFIKNKTKKEG